MAHAEATVITVYPTGYEKATFGDPEMFRLYVIRVDDEHDWWSVLNSMDWRWSGRLSSAGNWTFHRPPARNMRFYRFTREKALELALEHVDKYERGGMTFAQWNDHFSRKAV